jgi:hypothetical protein
VQAAVCRDLTGKIIKALSQTNPPCDPNFGEAIAARLAASLAASLKLKNFSLEGDSSVVISALNNPSITFNWYIESAIANAMSMLPATSLLIAKKIHQSANFCAHHVAFWATVRVFSGCIPIYFPPFSPIPFLVVKIHPLFLFDLL